MSRNWSFRAVIGTVALLAATATGDARAGQSFEDVHRCDELAAHPDDASRWASGVPDGAVVPGPAIKFCGQAAAEHPDTARFHFQLGRALWAADRDDEAVAAFLKAQEAGYAPAFAYLGQAYDLGIGGVAQDNEFALILYRMAADAGFAPAQALLAEIAASAAEEEGPGGPGQMAAADSDPVTMPAVPAAAGVDRAARLIEDVPHALETDEEFDPGHFSRGARLRLLYDGDFEALDATGDNYLLVYLLKVNEYLSESMNFHSPSCSAYADPDLAPGVMSNFIANMFDSSGNISSQGMEYLGEVFGVLAQGPGALLGRAAAMEAAQNAAQRDGVRLAQLYGCASPVFQRLYANLVNYVRGAGPAFASGWPGLRLACIQHASERGASTEAARGPCGCIATALAENGVAADRAEWLRVNYDHGANFRTVLGGDRALRREVGGCLL